MGSREIVNSLRSLQRNTVTHFNSELQGKKKLKLKLKLQNYLETSSQRGPLRVASLKAASMSDRILRRASVSCRGHRFPEMPPLPPSSPAPPSGSSAAGPNSSKLGAAAPPACEGAGGGGRALMGGAASGAIWNGVSSDCCCGCG